MTNSFTKKPSELVSWNRFDLPFKYLYAMSRLRDIQTSYYEEIYKHHLQIWNNFSEYKNPNKQSYTDFKVVFDKLIDDIAANGFDASKSSVPVEDNIHLLNGAHRLAACLASNAEISCYHGKDIIDGQLDCSWQFFRQHTRFGTINERFTDRACLELVKFRPEARIVTLYPSATNKGGIGKVRTILESRANIVYEKSLALTKLGGLNLVRELYYKEEWAEKNSGTGYKVKADLCYKPKNIFRKMSPTHIFVVEFDDQATAVSVKDDIRELYDLEKHSVHINDTHTQTVRLAKCILNENSIHFLNNFNGQLFPIFEKLLDEYQTWITENKLDPDDYCISAGSVLTAYGIKECKDIDYLHSADPELPGNELIQSHNSYGVDRYHAHKDEIIHNPENYFYRYGVKYSSLQVVKLLKQNRGEEKDFSDIALINKII